MPKTTERVCTRPPALTMILFVTGFAAGCDALVVNQPPGNPKPPSSMGMPGATTSDAGASAVDTPAAPAVGAGGGPAVTPPVADAGGGGGSTADAGPGGNPSSACDYPAGAPELTTTRFPVGSVMPNLTFTREDGTETSFKDIRCNKKNRLLLWSVGGDLCHPCIGVAMSTTIPAWKALAGEGLFVLESINGSGELVGPMPFTEWRRQTGWPMDGDGIAVVREPQMKPYYVMARIVEAIPWEATIDLETMKVLHVAGLGFGGHPGDEGTGALRARLQALPPRK
jgi:hypothetical protein